MPGGLPRNIERPDREFRPRQRVMVGVWVNVYLESRRRGGFKNLDESGPRSRFL